MSFTNEVQATHLRAGEIIVRRISCDANKYEITIIVYTDTGSDVRFGEGLLDFGDGTEPLPLPQIDNTSRGDLGKDVGTASFTTVHTYSSAGRFKIGYVEANRNEGVLNINNSVNTTFYVETEIFIDPFVGCNNSPVLLIPPIDRACPGVAFYHNPGAYDPDGDSLSYELVTPKMSLGTNVNGYEHPNDRQFYNSYSNANEDMDGPPDFEIDPLTGELTWDSPGAIGEYNIAFVVREWRFIAGEWVQMGFVTRDMQIIVEDCENERPELIIPEDICVEAGESVEEAIIGTDPDGDQVKIEAASLVFSKGATLEPDSVFRNSPLTADFKWQTSCEDISLTPYKVTFKISDNPPNGPSLVSFATWNITVVGPAPVLVAANQENQSIVLDWDAYTCKNADQIQVWRRVDSNPYEPDDCETGIREEAGYQLLTEVDANSVSYRDSDLSPGAKYCYRLVATFPSPYGGESIVSNEICSEPTLATEPVITRVSVDVTDQADGRITLEWREPFDLGTLTAPLFYRIYRSEGQTGSANRVMLVDKFKVDSTDPILSTYKDSLLNTTDLSYNYEVVLLDGDDEIPSAGTATKASSVRLTPVPQLKKIRLEWEAVVPWSNSIVNPPEDSKHLIYRGEEGAKEDDLVLIDEVDVTQFGYVYIDSGQYDNTELRDDRIYCYRIMTKGTYGNPDIYSPLLNYSQIVCAQPSDTVPPCKPSVTISQPDCNSNSCGFTDFENVLTWDVGFEGSCESGDVAYYEVYYAESTEAEFEIIANVETASFTHRGLDSYKGCYKVRAVDRSGNMSEFSESFCIDNCPHYELPNLLTPNNDNCNDLFSAYGQEGNMQDENGQIISQCGEVLDPTKCARFVESVDFTVFNRWGKKVYHYKGKSGSENGIYINWDGRDETGANLSSGVYYYQADVTFDVVDPSNAKQQFKGWIHIMR
ncbi:T9SS type B sorting domain-containing protein [Fulvivirga sediminis]|uniref:Gliding motility-associated C-terminal domain-containing protein n=1 Tax=Fulvivirga sediminis TaxID=2803949 RepID=A0A937K188_9BACT|nr:gliding motility-associated C-terminal domain-containing protein [Fulvivirga sediminis]MBL3656397.1 gliding motility-associated C-terminal domain-containing protein [Fulvivirga sediminis]